MRRRGLLPLITVGGVLAVRLVTMAIAAASLQASAAPAHAATAPAAEARPTWAQLSLAQRDALAPLEREWPSIDGDRKQKWLQIAKRVPGMEPAERQRVQMRMTEWARLSPQQRGEARMGFQEAKQLAPKDRKAEWEAYQALPADQKRQLQTRAAPAPAAPRTDGVQRNGDKSQAKSNIVSNPTFATKPKPIGPTVVQAQPGATTSLMSKRPTPPMHQQIGLPKIAATPEFVDKRTLLPRRGPQAAATRSAAASAPETPLR